MDVGLLLSLPLESLAIRAAVATLAGVALVRLLLRAGVRSPWARVATALAPGAALLIVIVATGTAVQPPVLMLPSDGVDALPIPVRDGFLYFAPMAPIVVGAWLTIVGFRWSRRAIGVLRARRAATAALAATARDRRVDVAARRVAAGFELPEPQVAIVGSCPGGALVVGHRRPIIVLAADLVQKLDDEELEGVLAHEFAHVRRRDNLVALVLGAIRDAIFFIPGGGWAVRQLHRERELAADQAAAAVTGRPAALASGLLKVMETLPTRAQVCAPLAPSTGLVDRVTVLLDDAPAPTPLRRGVEVAAVVSAVAIAATAALTVPGAVAGQERERDQLALVWSATPPVVLAETAVQAEARAFGAYRRANLDVAARPVVVPATSLSEDSQDNRRAALHACAETAGTCPVATRTPSLGLQPPTIRIDESLNRRWDAVPVGNSEAADGFRLFWLAQRPE